MPKPKPRPMRWRGRSGGTGGPTEVRLPGSLPGTIFDMSRTSRSNQAAHRTWEGQHRFEHLYRDNQVYFITARCRARFPAFADEQAKQIFWSRFDAAAR